MMTTFEKILYTIYACLSASLTKFTQLNFQREATSFSIIFTICVQFDFEIGTKFILNKIKNLVT